MRWQADRAPVSRGFRYRILAGELPLSTEQYFTLLRDDADFRRWYSELISSSNFDALFWEHPRITTESLAEPAEFVLLDSPSLAGFRPDPSAFSSIFAATEEAQVATFPNLGGDATLIAPLPRSGYPGYPHLAAFLRSAPGEQTDSLWAACGEQLLARVSSYPCWLSTSGLGVPWLHLRLDSSPKYYQHLPYKQAGA